MHRYYLVNGAPFVVIAVDKKPIQRIFPLRGWIYSLIRGMLYRIPYPTLSARIMKNNCLIEVVASNERQ